MYPDETQSSVQEAAASPAAGLESAEARVEASSSAEVSNMLESMETLTPVLPGGIVKGRVLKVTETDVLVDIGLKSEVVVPRAEFLSDDGQITVAPGDEIDVSIDQLDEAAGTVTVSHRKAARLKAWEEIERAFQDQTNLRGRVVERVKGGLAVDVGVRAFLPGSHADSRPHFNLDSLKGEEVVCKVIKFNKKRENVVVSRKLAMEEEAGRRKAELMERLVEGAEITGRVKNLTDYGVFVDLGGMDGLLHITDLSWVRVGHPSEVVQPGQEIKVKVLNFDREKERVSLGLKQFTPDPWENVPASYHVGERVTGRVVRIADFGVFVELAPGIEGLVHISEMTWSKRLKHPSKVVSVDDHVAAAVLEVNPSLRRISLSLRQTLPDPWDNLAQRFPVGTTVQGRVRNLTEFGAFVEVEEGVEGLIHLSNLSWTKSVKHPSEVLKKGQRVEAAVLSIDSTNRRLSLGLKQLQPDVWKEFFAKTHVDDILKGKVSRLAPFGAFVLLQEGIEGLCHFSEFGKYSVEGGADRLEVGSELDFRVIRLNPTEKKIGLSLKQEADKPPRAQNQDREKEPSRPAIMSTMAEALSSAGVILPDSGKPAAADGPKVEAGEENSQA